MMVSIEPIELEAGQNKNEIQEEKVATDKNNAKRVSRRCWIIVIIVTVVIIAAAVILGVVFGVVKKDNSSSSAGSSGQSYKVEIHWQASTFDGWTYGFLEYGTDATVQDGGEAWDDQNEFKVKLDVQDDGKANVKSEVHHICCAHELEAGGNIIVDSGSWGNWGGFKNCRCDQLWYDHQIRAKVTTVN